MIQMDFNNEVVRAAPIAGTVAVDATTRLIWGLSLNEWFYVAAIIYTFAQTFALIWRTVKNKERSDGEQHTD